MHQGGSQVELCRKRLVEQADLASLENILLPPNQALRSSSGGRGPALAHLLVSLDRKSPPL